MLFEKFQDLTLKFWDDYFKKIRTAQAAGQLDAKGGFVLYPNILLVTNCGNYYITELMGASRVYSGLRLRVHKEKSIQRYIGQFDKFAPDSKPFMTFDEYGGGINSMLIGTEGDTQSVLDRFPFIELYKTNIKNINKTGCLLGFSDNFISCSIRNSALINKSEQIIRVKNILTMYIFKKGITTTQVLNEYNNFGRDNYVQGVHTVMSDSDERAIIASQLQNAYLFQGLRETTIGEFIKLHPDIIKKAFKTDHFLYEPSFKWLEHDGSCQDSMINPDLLIRRSDGTYDIYDLKTSLLNKLTLTSTERRRRQFIHTVRDGIAQLGNYREYFSYPKNAKHAFEKYGVVISNPGLVLVVGNLDNYNATEVDQALRTMPGIKVINYDTLCFMFRGTGN